MSNRRIYWTAGPAPLHNHVSHMFLGYETRGREAGRGQLSSIVSVFALARNSVVKITHENTVQSLKCENCATHREGGEGGGGGSCQQLFNSPVI
jgi:hypothetical protein